jgi:hypothetical protein
MERCVVKSPKKSLLPELLKLGILLAGIAKDMLDLAKVWLK